MILFSPCSSSTLNGAQVIIVYMFTIKAQNSGTCMKGLVCGFSSSSLITACWKSLEWSTASMLRCSIKDRVGCPFLWWRTLEAK